MEILFRELLRLLSALLNALLNQSWQPLEGALGEMGAGSGLLLIVMALGSMLLLLLLLLFSLLAITLYYRRRGRLASAATAQINHSGRDALKIQARQ